MREDDTFRVLVKVIQLFTIFDFIVLTITERDTWAIYTEGSNMHEGTGAGVFGHNNNETL